MSVFIPERNWWAQPLGKDEKLWLKVCVLTAIILFLMMPLYNLTGHQNPSHEGYKVSPERFNQLTEDFVAKNKVRDEVVKQRFGTTEVEMKIPVVHPGPGVKDIYLRARAWEFYPILELEEGREYRVHMSSMDYQHGFSLQPQNINFQILSGYDLVVTMTPRETGEFYVICNEYCALGHHTMIGKIIVK
ncbi:MAG: cytochrome C oxidase subunit II [Candidatus Marinimicrobia bacterium]|jgi:cytochrome c oxidase subunit 2|nr:cytochrome C oxidase subunit II [Candidatus Neomarinimicrobiota bacterium]